MDTWPVVASSHASRAPSGRALTPPTPLSQPPPRLTGERGAGTSTKAGLLLAVLPLLPVGGRAMGEEGRGDEGAFSLFSRSGGGRWEKRVGVMRVLLFSLFSRQVGGRLGEEGRG